MHRSLAAAALVTSLALALSVPPTAEAQLSCEGGCEVVAGLGVLGLGSVLGLNASMIATDIVFGSRGLRPGWAVAELILGGVQLALASVALGVLAENGADAGAYGLPIGFGLTALFEIGHAIWSLAGSRNGAPRASPGDPLAWRHPL